MKKFQQLLLAGLILTSTMVPLTTAQASSSFELPAPGYIPMRSVVKLLRIASTTWGIPMGQLLHKYFTGDLTITHVQTTPPTKTYMIELDGACILAALEDNL